MTAVVKLRIEYGRWGSCWCLLALVLGFMGCDLLGQVDAVVSGHSKTLYVSASSEAKDPDGSSWRKAFISVQKAVDVAADGDTILIDAGPHKASDKQDAVIYIENKKGLKLLGGRSAQGPRQEQETVSVPSVLDGEQSFGNILHVVWIENSQDITFSEFTLRNGDAQEDASEHDTENWGAGILVHKSRNIEFRDVRITGNKAHWGGGLAVVDSSDVRLIDCEFTNNEASHRLAEQFPVGGVGGAIAIKNSRHVNLQNITLKNNVATIQAGGLYGEDCQVDVTDSTFEANGFQEETQNNLSGGALFLDRCKFTAKGSKWTNNQAQQAGALLADNTQLTLEGGEFTGNTATGNAAAVLAQHGSVVVVRNVKFSGNNTQQNGGALSIVSASRVMVEGATFEANQANGSCPIAMLSQEQYWEDGGRNVYKDNVDSGSSDDVQGFVCKP
ncbi:MAG: right-handed parallel beta-helix repeat-containing protein [Myxococcota bacterium]